jgi:hypothetical protein
MSTLTRLHVYAVSPGLSDKGLLQLTALKGLQELGLKYHPSAEYNMSIIGERWAPSEKILKVSPLAKVLCAVHMCLHGTYR